MRNRIKRFFSGMANGTISGIRYISTGGLYM